MALPSRGLDMLRHVDVQLSVELGRTRLKLADVLALTPDSVVVLDRMTDELLDIHVNGQPIGKAEIVTDNNQFALRVVSLDDRSADGALAAPAGTGA